MNIRKKLVEIIRSEETQLPTLPVIVDNVLKLTKQVILTYTKAPFPWNGFLQVVNARREVHLSSCP